MPAEETISEFFEAAVYALVIGISTYENGFSAGQDPENKFPNLKCADKDATDFRNFLVDHGVNENTILFLVNEKATLKNIKSGFNQLMKFCKMTVRENGDPLVFIFFAGHGWNEDGKNYLVPYEGELDNLYSSCFKNTEFTECLHDLDTSKLVIFLDACHSGAMELNGSRGGNTALEVEQLGSGSGRYLFASCAKGQQSYELEDNGIFTRHLLDILNFNLPELADKEVLTTELLAGTLAQKVKTTALQKLGKVQEPLYDASMAQGIKLNVNVNLRKKKQDEGKFNQKKRIEFRDKIYLLFEKKHSKFTEKMRARLDGYIQREEVITRFAKYYKLFDEGFDEWFLNDFTEEAVAETSNDLANCYELIIQSKKDSNPEPLPAVAEKTDKVIKEGESQGTTSARSSLIPGTAYGDSQLRRNLKEHSDYILGPLPGVKRFMLGRCLNEPVSIEEFMMSLDDTRKDYQNDNAGLKMLDEINERFLERWKAVEVTPTSSTANLLLNEMKVKKDQ